MQVDLNPFVGPRPFEKEEGGRFFGRERESSHLGSLVIAHPEVLLFAQSGAGKTSLLNAKLIPFLRQNKFEVFPSARVSGPDEATGSLLEGNVYIFNALRSWGSSETPADGLSLTLQAFLANRPRDVDIDGSPCARALIFDQFEELFILYPERWRERRKFFDQLGEALRKDALLRVVFVMREEYLADLDSHVSVLPGRVRARMRLELLRENSALAAVTGPLKGSSRAFAPGVAEKLVSDLRSIPSVNEDGRKTVVLGEFVEPAQLQVVCQRLWQEIPSKADLITEEYVKSFGDINSVLADFYDAALAKVSEKGKIGQGKLRGFFGIPLITDERTRGMVVRGSRRTGNLPNAVVAMLEGEHLIRGERRGEVRWYELSHDRLIESIRLSNSRFRRHQIQRSAALLAICMLIGIPLLAFFIARGPIFRLRAEPVLSGWGLPSDLIKYERQLRELSVDCGVNDLRWLPRELTSLDAHCFRIKTLEGVPSGLERLDLSETGISSLEGLPPHVEDLNIAHTRIDDLSALKNKRIRSLDLSSIDVKDMRQIPRSVKHLRLQNPNIDSLEGLPEGLESLELIGTTVRDIKGLPGGLRELTLRNNALLHIGVLPSHLERLEADDLSESALLPVSLKYLTVIRSSLKSAPVGTEELTLFDSSWMGPLPQALERLDIRDEVGVGLLNRLPRHLKSLGTIWPEGKGFDQLPSGLLALDLSGSIRLTSLAKAKLEWLKDLNDLNVSATNLPDLREIPSSVEILRFDNCRASELSIFPAHLKVLSLAGCRELRFLSGLPASLLELDINGTALSRVDLPPNLIKLNISNSNIAGSLPGLPVRLEDLTLGVTQVDTLRGLPKTVKRLRFVRLKPW